MTTIDDEASRIFNNCGYEFKQYESAVAQRKTIWHQISLTNDDRESYLEKLQKERKEKRHLTFLYSLIMLEFYSDYELLLSACSLALNINHYEYVIKNLSTLNLTNISDTDLYPATITILAKAYRNSNQFERSLECYKEAQAYYALRNDKLNESWMIYSIGKMYLNYLQQPSRSIDILQEAKANFEQLETKERHRGISACLDELGDVYRQGLKDYGKAINVYQEALKYNMQKDRYYPAGISRNYSHIGLCYWQMGDYGKAQQYLENAIEIIQNIPGQEKGLGIRLTQLGKVQVDNNFYHVGYNNLLKGQEYNERYLNTEYLITNLIYQGDYYDCMEQPDKALAVYLKSIDNSRHTLFYDLTSTAYNKVSNCYFKLSLFNESKGALIKSITNKTKYWSNIRSGAPQSKIANNPEIGEMYQSWFYKLSDVYTEDLNNTVTNLDRVYDALILEYEQHKRNYISILRFASIMTGIKHEIQNLHNDIVAVISDILEEKYTNEYNLDTLAVLKKRIFEKSNILSHDNLKEITSGVNNAFKLTRNTLEDIIAGIATDFRMSNLHIETDISEIDCSIAIDEISLRYILFNIMLNSKESFEASIHSYKLIKVVAYTKSGEFHISINDNAGGVEPEHLERVFDFGYTTKPGSTGYGLPSIKTMLLSSNGEIKLKNNDINGLEVSFKFLLI